MTDNLRRSIASWRRNEDYNRETKRIMAEREENEKVKGEWVIVEYRGKDREFISEPTSYAEAFSKMTKNEKSGLKLSTLNRGYAHFNPVYRIEKFQPSI